METGDCDVIYRPLLDGGNFTCTCPSGIPEDRLETYREGIVIATARGNHTKTG